MTILVIVESKAKAPKIKSILGKEYTVLACFGHLQNLTNNLKWLDKHIESGWNPDTIPYQIIPTKAKVLKELRAAANKASKVIIASDMDREGEAIGHHLYDLLDLKKKKIPTEPRKSEILWKKQSGERISRLKSPVSAPIAVPLAIFCSKESAASYWTSRPLSTCT